MSEQKTPAVYAAIVQVMSKLAGEGIGKNRKNEQQGFKFRGIDDVYNALSRHLADAQLCVLPWVQTRDVQERTTKSGALQYCVTLVVDFQLVSAIDGSTHLVRAVGEACDSGDKATNKAMSAAYKYAMFQTFCIPVEGDDADATTPEPVASKSRGSVDDALTAIGACASLELLNNLKAGLATFREDPRFEEITSAFRAKVKSLEGK